MRTCVASVRVLLYFVRSTHTLGCVGATRVCMHAMFFLPSAYKTYFSLLDRLKAVVILLVSTVLMALVAEILVENVQEIVDGSGISEVFLGLTVIALVSEFVFSSLSKKQD